MSRPDTEEAASAVGGTAVTRLSKRLGDVEAVREVDLDVPAGGIAAILGPSGCGKTTTLRLVAGPERPDAGTIRIGGTVVAEGGPGGRHVPPDRRGVGFVFQDYALFPHLTAAENVAFGLPRRGSTETRARVSRLLDRVDLTARRDRRPEALSGGEQQRVALARALAPSPSLLLLDEPFANLDAALRRTLRDQMRTLLRESGSTVILVTHDQEEALGLADRVAIMLDGRIIQTGTAEDVYRRPRTPEVARLVGDGFFVPGHLERGVVETALGRHHAADLPGSDACDEGPVRLFVRPENLALGEPGLGDGGIGEVIDVVFVGVARIVHLRLPGVEPTIRVRLDPDGAVPARGESVRVVIRRSGDVRVYAS